MNIGIVASAGAVVRLSTYVTHIWDSQESGSIFRNDGTTVTGSENHEDILRWKPIEAPSGTEENCTWQVYPKGSRTIDQNGRVLYFSNNGYPYLQMNHGNYAMATVGETEASLDVRGKMIILVGQHTLQSGGDWLTANKEDTPANTPDLFCFTTPYPYHGIRLQYQSTMLGYVDRCKQNDKLVYALVCNVKRFSSRDGTDNMDVYTWTSSRGHRQGLAIAPAVDASQWYDNAHFLNALGLRAPQEGMRYHEIRIYDIPNGMTSQHVTNEIDMLRAKWGFERDSQAFVV